MRYVVGLGVLNPELKILFQSDIWLLRFIVKVLEINNFGNNFLFIFFNFVKVQLPIWQLIIYAYNRKQKFMERWDELW